MLSLLLEADEHVTWYKAEDFLELLILLLSQMLIL